MIKLHNNLTRKLEVFEPIDAGNVRIYSCGPTVYDRAHLGNARPEIIFDVLTRLLRHVYGENNVQHARNITDVDDKINARARQAGRKISEITAETTAWYHEDLDALGVQRPNYEPHATDYIDEMIRMITELLARGHAYAAEGHVLFDVHSYEAYGRFSGRSIDEMMAGARVEIAPYKRHPMDFVLWKPADGEVGWESPWGFGRPGWHIECSAMTRALFGDVFDIHTGGIDLQFPHHENEIAQSCACSGQPTMANYWLHNEMLQVEGMKMSKSLGNFFTVRDLIDQGIPGEVIRFVMLQTHYASPMEWTDKKREEAEATLRKWRALTLNVKAAPNPAQEVIEALSSDLNTAGAITALHAIAKSGNGALLKTSAALLGLLTDEMAEWSRVDYDFTALTQHLLKLRAKAVLEKDFSMLDQAKAILASAGVEIRMSKENIELSAGAGFDPSKLSISESSIT